MPKIKHRASNIILFSAFSVFFFCVIFLLPYYFPNNNPTTSLSYAFGFNNKVSIIGTLIAIIALCVFVPILTLRKTFSASNIFPQKTQADLPGPKDKLFWIYAFIYILIAIFCLLVFSDPNFHGEDDFFIRNIDLLQMGKIPYTDFWFHFGPGSIYIPLLIKTILGPLGVSTKISYYIFHAFVNLLSLFLLYLFINKLDIEQRYKNLIFGIIALLQLNFTMGIQYTLIRTLPAFYFLSIINSYFIDNLGSGSIKKNLVLFTLPSLFLALMFALFIETGLAFFVSITIYLLATSFINSNKKALIILFCMLISVPFLMTIIPHSIIRGLLNYVGGGQNFPVFPSPPVLMYLFSLFYSVPLLFLANNIRGSKPIYLSYAILCASLMPGAFGRSDPGHIFYYGVGTFILTAAILARASTKAFKAYITIFTLVFAFSWFSSIYSVSLGKISASLYSSFGKYLFSDGQIIKFAGKIGLDKNKVLRIIEYEKDFSHTNYSALINYRSLATPLLIDNRLYNYLVMNGKFVPEYYLYTINVDTKSQLLRKIKDLNRNEYLIVPKHALEGFNAPASPAVENRFYSRLLFYPVMIPNNKPAPDMGKEFMKYIVLRYKKADEFGQYYIYKKKSAKHQPGSYKISNI